MIKREQLETMDFVGKLDTPIHPGEHLLDYLEGAGITQYRLAKDIHVSARRINEIAHGNRAITADTALRLGRYFSTTAQFWMNLQANYELTKANQGDILDIMPIAAQVCR